MSYGFTCKAQEKENLSKKKKDIALSTIEEDSNEDSSSDKEINLLTRKLKRFINKNKFTQIRKGAKTKTNLKIDIMIS